MDISSSGITLFIGIGRQAERVVDHYVTTYERIGLESDPVSENRHLFISILQGRGESDQGEFARRTMASQSQLRMRWNSPEDLLALLYQELDSFMEASATTIHDNSEINVPFQLDVVITGHLQDPFYLESFLKIVVLVEELIHGKYEALVRVTGSPSNASFLILPIAMSSNLRAEPHRKEIISMILATEKWHGQLPLTRKCIPRFFLFDGFARNVMTSLHDQVGMVSDVLTTLADQGIRRLPQMRLLFNFSNHKEDFISILSIASASFATHLLADYCHSHALLRFFGGFLENPVGASASEVAALFEPVQTLLEPAQLEKEFSEARMGFDLMAMLTESIPSFDTFIHSGRDQERIYKASLPKAKDERLFDEEPVSQTGAQQTYLPLLHWNDTPESLSEFFDQEWRDHPRQLLLHSDTTGMADRFSSYHEAVDSCGILLQEKVGTALRGTIDRSLETNAGRRRIATTLDYLRHNLSPSIRKSLHEWNEKTSKLSLPDAPNLDDFEVEAEKFRKSIWNLTTLGVMALWTAFFLPLLSIAWFHIAPLVLDYLPKGLFDGFLDKAATPPWAMATAVAMALFTFVLPFFAFRWKIRRRLKKTVRSEYPYRRMVSREAQNLALPTRSPGERAQSEKKIEKLEKKIHKAVRRRGVLAARLEKARRDYRIYWQTRLELSTNIWIRRILIKARDIVEEEINNLDKLRTTLDRHRSDLLDDLRRKGDTPENRTQCAMIPQSTPFQVFLLGNDLLDNFAVSQRAIREDPAMSTHFLQRYKLLSGWRMNSPLYYLDVMRVVARSLYPIFDQGLFTLKEYDTRIMEQVQSFFATLDNRLSAGDQFRFFASLEENAVVCDSGIHVFCHSTASRYVKTAMNTHAHDENRLVTASANSNRITAIRILHDIHVDTLMRYFGFRLQTEEPPPEEQIEDIWHTAREMVGIG